MSEVSCEPMNLESLMFDVLTSAQVLMWYELRTMKFFFLPLQLIWQRSGIHGPSNRLSHWSR
jgi:hypothetical protein